MTDVARLFVTRVIINQHPLELQRDGNFRLMNFRKCNYSSRVFIFNDMDLYIGNRLTIAITMNGTKI